MSYFPMYFNLENKKILLVGAGFIAEEKLDKLLDFTKDIHIISQDISENINTLINANNLSFIKKAYEKNDYLNFDIIIVAVDDLELQKSIYKETRNSRILCNCVDLPAYCDFIFPSYIKKDDLIVSISTSGSSPAFAKEFKKYIHKIIPDNIGEFLKEMKSLRTSMPKGQKRMDFFDKKVKEYFKLWN